MSEPASEPESTDSPPSPETPSSRDSPSRDTPPLGEYPSRGTPSSGDSPSSPDTPPSPESSPDAAGGDPNKPTYKGAPLDAEAGPGLGCFYLQVVLLVILLIVTPLSVVWAFPPWISAGLLILTLVILFFVGMTMVFLLRLVAADRRAQRRPLREGARKTVGQLESEEKDAGTGDSAPEP